MGAVANLAPDRFRAIHAAVPFVDALTTILDPDLPLTVIEWEEWGDPLHDPEVYAYMKSYTPVRERRGQELPGDPGHHQPERHPGLLRRAGQVGRGAAAGRDQRRRPTDPVEDRDGRRSRRGQRPLQGVAGEGVRVRLDHRPGRRGLSGSAAEPIEAASVRAPRSEGNRSGPRASARFRREDRLRRARPSRHAPKSLTATKSVGPDPRSPTTQSKADCGQVDPVQDLATLGDPDAAALPDVGQRDGAVVGLAIDAVGVQTRGLGPDPAIGQPAVGADRVRGQPAPPRLGHEQRPAVVDDGHPVGERQPVGDPLDTCRRGATSTTKPTGPASDGSTDPS